MALPKSMRILAGATICVFLFLFVKIMNAPSAGELQVPTKVPLSKDGQWDHDPQEDRKYILDSRRLYDVVAYRVHSIWGTSRASSTSRWKQLRTEQSEQRTHQRYPLESGAK